MEGLVKMCQKWAATCRITIDVAGLGSSSCVLLHTELESLLMIFVGKK